MDNNEKRLSNFDLMKIISMFLILVWHYIHNTNLLNKTTGVLHFSLVVLWFTIIIHVNSFIVSMGYFQIDKKFKFSRVLSLNNSAWFYKVLFLIVFVALGTEVSAVEKLELLSPLTLYKQYWFLATYLILYCLSPFINRLINNLSKRGLHQFIFALFIFASILSTLTGQTLYNVESGHSIFTFILLYTIGAYIKKYPIDNNYYFKNISTKLRNVIFIVVYLFLVLFNSFLYHYGEELLLSNNEIVKYIGNILVSLKLGFDNPIVIVQSIIYFLIFDSLKIKNNFISKLSSLTFGIYLIHDNLLVRGKLYNEFYKISFKYSFFNIYGRIFISSLIVFVICIFAEFIRKKIFKLLSKTKISKKLKETTIKFFYEIGLNMNW